MFPEPKVEPCQFWLAMQLLACVQLMSLQTDRRRHHAGPGPTPRGRAGPPPLGILYISCVSLYIFVYTVSGRNTAREISVNYTYGKCINVFDVLNVLNVLDLLDVFDLLCALKTYLP